MLGLQQWADGAWLWKTHSSDAIDIALAWMRSTLGQIPVHEIIYMKRQDDGSEWLRSVHCTVYDKTTLMQYIAERCHPLLEADLIGKYHSAYKDLKTLYKEELICREAKASGTFVCIYRTK